MENRLKYFTISFFSIILGLSGLSIATHRAEVLFNLPHIHNYLGFFTASIYALFLVVYLLKWIKYPEEALGELNHPVKRSFFATISVSLIMLSIIFLESFPQVSKYLLLVGMVSHLYFTLYILSVWIMHDKIDIKHKNPAWFIPIVGNVLIPIPAMAHFHADVSWFFFSIGLILWIVLFTIFIYRSIFHQPLSEKLLPTFFILIAPPSIAFIAYFKITGELDGFAKVIYFFALFTTLLLFFNARSFARIKFFLSWWAYSFPISAIIIATLLMFEQSGFFLFKYIAIGLFLFLIGLIIYLIVKTILEMMKQKICVPED